MIITIKLTLNFHLYLYGDVTRIKQKEFKLNSLIIIFTQLFHLRDWSNSSHHPLVHYPTQDNIHLTFFISPHYWFIYQKTPELKIKSLIISPTYKSKACRHTLGFSWKEKLTSRNGYHHKTNKQRFSLVSREERLQRGRKAVASPKQILPANREQGGETRPSQTKIYQVSRLPISYCAWTWITMIKQF